MHYENKTVGDLIKELSQFDPNEIVTVEGNYVRRVDHATIKRPAYGCSATGTQRSVNIQSE